MLSEFSIYLMQIFYGSSYFSLSFFILGDRFFHDRVWMNTFFFFFESSIHRTDLLSRFFDIFFDVFTLLKHKFKRTFFKKLFFTASCRIQRICICYDFVVHLLLHADEMVWSFSNTYYNSVHKNHHDIQLIEIMFV